MGVEILGMMKGGERKRGRERKKIKKKQSQKERNRGDKDRLILLTTHASEKDPRTLGEKRTGRRRNCMTKTMTWMTGRRNDTQPKNPTLVPSAKVIHPENEFSSAGLHSSRSEILHTNSQLFPLYNTLA